MINHWHMSSVSDAIVLFNMLNYQQNLSKQDASVILLIFTEFTQQCFKQRMHLFTSLLMQIQDEQVKWGAYGEMKKGRGSHSQGLFFWHVMCCWMGGLSKYLNKCHICWGKVQPALALPPLSQLALLVVCVCANCFLEGRSAYGRS